MGQRYQLHLALRIGGVLLQKSRKISTHIFDAAGLTFAMTRPLLKFLLHPCLLVDREPVPQSTVWVKKLSGGAATLNNEVTSLTGKKPALAIKEKAVPTKLSTPYWLGKRKTRTPLMLMYAISTNLASLQVV